MTESDSPHCSECGKADAIYLVAGVSYCPACMRKKHPPLKYRGPERRRRQVATSFRRRGSDFAENRQKV